MLRHVLRRKDRVASSSRRSVALIVTPRYLPLLGGMERECALLARQLRSLGWDTVVITEKLGMALPTRQIADGIMVIRVPSRPRRSAFVQLRVAAAIAILVLRYRRRARFAIVRTFTLPAMVVGLLKALRLIAFPTLVTAETGGEDDDVVALERRPLFRFSRAIVSRNDVLNGLCQSNVDHLHAAGFPAEKITKIPNGIDTRAWQTTSSPLSVTRFLFLGRLEAAKGVYELIEAVHQLRREHPDVSLAVAGEGEARDDLERRCAELELTSTVRFLGRVPYETLGEVFGDSDCLVLPSYSEGMPLSVLEAAAHHRVLIVTEVGDIAMLFGDRVRTCPPRDVPALVAAMDDAVRSPDPATEYGDIIHDVSIERVADALVTQLLDSRSSRP
jgi:glycosyltransferase involved in cell wall biosynthesis